MPEKILLFGIKKHAKPSEGAPMLQIEKLFYLLQAQGGTTKWTMDAIYSDVRCTNCGCGRQKSSLFLASLEAYKTFPRSSHFDFSLFFVNTLRKCYSFKHSMLLERNAEGEPGIKWQWQVEKLPVGSKVDRSWFHAYLRIEIWKTAIFVILTLILWGRVWEYSPLLRNWEPKFSIYILGQCLSLAYFYAFAIYWFAQCESPFSKMGCINALKAHYEDNGHEVKRNQMMWLWKVFP